ncbi:hypothetical protein EHS25_005706 [Saitozyma podzolica]|uniref:HNH nuclease domain-containing protein n=1 Tax=Saitozyma podzolica TaxID=1890683 RepID=A0A427XVQ8_9TREE|nr:hypothetical protein EHS25_005706 [Saitozyma podzolica]
MPPRTYSLAVQSWSDQPITIRCFRTDERIASFPLEFVRRGGNNTWQYVMDVVNQLVEQAAGGRPVIRTSSGEEVSLTDAPTSGVFKYEQVGSPDALKFSRGPEYFSPFQPPTGEYSSTRSNSTRSTTNQTRFRVQLIGRDGTCLVTDIAHDYCTASHIVPFSRPDVYQSILGLDYDPPMFAPSAGLLLRQDLHHAFDRLELSFLYKASLSPHRQRARTSLNELYPAKLWHTLPNQADGFLVFRTGSSMSTSLF